MKVKALISFVGAFSMVSGEIRECSDEATLQDLLQAGYVEKIEDKEKITEDKELSKDEDLTEDEEKIEDEETKKSARKTTKKVVNSDESK